MPSIRAAARPLLGVAKTTVRRALRQMPWLEDLARDAYFDVANRPWVQDRAYQEWLEAHRLFGHALTHRRLRAREWTRQRFVSIVLDLTGAGTEAAARAIAGITGQAYENWELVVVRDTTLPGDRARPEHRVQTVISGASRAARLTAGLARCHGDLVCLLTADDVLYPDSLYELCSALDAEPDAAIVYGGEDLVSLGQRPRRHDPFFKPDWNPELLRSLPYLGSFTLLSAAVVREVGGIRDLGAEATHDDLLWDLQLRVVEAGRRVAHAVVPVASRVFGPVTTASAARELLAGDGLDIRPQPELPGAWQTRHPVTGSPLVSIVIPSKNQLAVVRRCVESVLGKTGYQAYEVVLVDTGSDAPGVREWYAEVAARDDRFRVVEWPEQPFSYARACNEGARQSRGDVLVMLNNDTEVLDADWLDVLVGEAQRPEVGAVGCLLLYPDGRTVQHAGIGLGIKGVAGNSLTGLRIDEGMSRTQRTMLWTRRATSAVTGACLAVRKGVYEEVGGFDEAFRVTFNDVDLCLRINERGYRTVYTPYTRLLHHESVSVSVADAGRRDWTELYAAADLFKQRWGALTLRDPQMNPHLSKGTTSYRLVHHGL